MSAITDRQVSVMNFCQETLIPQKMLKISIGELLENKLDFRVVDRIKAYLRSKSQKCSAEDKAYFTSKFWRQTTPMEQHYDKAIKQIRESQITFFLAWDDSDSLPSCLPKELMFHIFALISFPNFAAFKEEAFISISHSETYYKDELITGMYVSSSW